jgi:hypothetical protein
MQVQSRGFSRIDHWSSLAVSACIYLLDILNQYQSEKVATLELERWTGRSHPVLRSDKSVCSDDQEVGQRRHCQGKYVIEDILTTQLSNVKNLMILMIKKER